MRWVSARRAISTVVLGLSVGYVVWRIASDRDAVDLLRTIPIWAVVALTAMQIAYLLPQAYRYWLALQHVSAEDIPGSAWIRLFVVGRFLNSLVPQAGNVYRASRLKTEYGLPLTRYVSAFLAFTWLSTGLNLMVAAAVITVLEPSIAVGNVAGLLVVTLALVLVVFGPPALLWLTRRFTITKGRLGWAHGRMEDLLGATVNIVRQRPIMIRFVGAGLVGIGIALAIFAVAFESLSLSGTVSSLLLFFVLTQLSTYINITPGNLGIFELGFGALGAQLGIGLVGGLLLASLVRLTGYLALLVAGLALGGRSALAQARSVRTADGRWDWVRQSAVRLQGVPLLNRLLRPVLRVLWNAVWWPAVWFRMRRSPLVQLDLDVGRLTVDLRDKGVAWPLYRYREYEPAERFVMRLLVEPGMHVIDLGAQFGYHSLLLAQLVGEVGKVVAVEPSPHNFKVLTKNLQDNDAENVVAVNAAASDHIGEVRLAMDSRNLGAHHIVAEASQGHTLAVEAVPVDAIIAEEMLKPQFVKMDIEGAELTALHGMDQTLRSTDLAILAELNSERLEEAGATSAELLSYLTGAGFTLFVLEADGRLTQTDETALIAVGRGVANVNFIAAKGAAIGRATAADGTNVA